MFAKRDLLRSFDNASTPIAAADASVVTLSNLPATARQRRFIYSVMIFFAVAYGATVPFVAVETPQLSALLVIVLTLIMTSNFISAGLMLVQSLLASSVGLLILANGYLYSSLIMIPYLLAFPQIFGAKPVLGDSLQDPPFLYLCWHFGFLAAVCCYAAFKTVPLGRARLLVEISIATTVGIIGIFVWVIARHGDMLPLLLRENFGPTALARYVAAVELAIGILAMALLWVRSRSLLDCWLVVVVGLVVFELSLVTFFLVTRNTVGALLVRSYFAISSIVILMVLLAESTRLYANVARANVLFERERNSRLMNLQAMVASIAHEVRQPLGAIVTSGSAALRFLDRSPAELTEARIALNRIVNDGHRTSEIFDGLRTLFGRITEGRQALHMNDIVRAALENVSPELQANDIRTFPELMDKLPPIDGNRAQLHEAVLNLLQNAIEAMAGGSRRNRTLRIKTGYSGCGSAVSLEIEDSGPGIDPETLNSVFEAFVTTKPQGTGLGLAICRMIVEEHGGEINAANGTQGAMFRLILPVAGSQAAAVGNGAGGDRLVKSAVYPQNALGRIWS